MSLIKCAYIMYYTDVNFAINTSQLKNSNTINKTIILVWQYHDYE